jgi:predicted acetyltransferase
MSNVRSNKTSDLRLVKINESDLVVYKNLAHSYEAEFSSLTKTMPNKKGIFEPATLPISPYAGYLLYKGDLPIGFCVAEIGNDINDIAEFYIIPSMRGNKLGYSLAATVFQLHHGKWQVRQIEGAEAAKNFWRKVVNRYTQNKFEEEIVDDSVWGKVTRQRFDVSGLNITPGYNSNNGLPVYGIFPNANIKIEISERAAIMLTEHNLTV